VKGIQETSKRVSTYRTNQDKANSMDMSLLMKVVIRMQLNSIIDILILIGEHSPIGRQKQFQNQISSYIDTFKDQDSTYFYLLIPFH